jgi:transcriptional antiterminator NusG
MGDEENKTLEDRLAEDDSSLVADDAVTNRSDDTALDEADLDRSDNGEAVAADHESGVADDVPEDAHAADEAAVTDESDAEEEIAEETEESATEAARPAKPPLMEEVPEEEIRMDWYILKVQSNRERSIAEALERTIKIKGLDRFFDQVIVPTEKVTEFKGGKKKVVERKLYPGYIVVHMHINDDTWFAVRETSGVGDFTGSGGKPTPMLQHEVARIVQTEEEETSETPKLDIRFASGDKVKVKEGNFENFEGEVNTIDEASGRVTVMINIFGRSTPVELEYWQIEAV